MISQQQKDEIDKLYNKVEHFKGIAFVPLEEAKRSIQRIKC